MGTEEKDTGWHAIPHINSSAHREFSEWIPQYNSAPYWKQHTDLHSTHKLGVTTFTTGYSLQDPAMGAKSIRSEHSQAGVEHTSTVKRRGLHSQFTDIQKQGNHSSPIL